MPELFKARQEKYVAVEPKFIVCILNVQHNCYDGKCSATGRRRTRQERTVTEVEESYIVHSDDTRYIINMHALHNAALLRKVLPRNLTAPVRYIIASEREAEHRKMAASLRAAQDTRRAKEAASRREKQKAVAAAKATAAAASSSQGHPAGDSAVPPRPRKRTRQESGPSTLPHEDTEGHMREESEAMVLGASA